MSSKYGFETAEDRAKDQQELMHACEGIDGQLQDIVNDYLSTIDPPASATITRNLDEPTWLVTDPVLLYPFPLSIKLEYPPLGNKKPRFYIRLYSRIAANARNTRLLLDLLEEKLGYPAAVKVIDVDVEDEETKRVLSEANLWP